MNSRNITIQKIQIMGIRHLHKFLKKHSPDVYQEIGLSTYRNKIIAIDINLYLYYYKNKHKQRWLSAFFNMILTLRKYDMKLIFIYDTRAPVEKESKQLERKTKKRNIEAQIHDIRYARARFIESGDIDPILNEVMEKTHKSSRMKKLLSPDNNMMIDLQVIDAKLVHLENQIVNVTRKDVQTSKELLTILKIPFYDSPNEAETMCSHLCCYGMVDAVLSNDTDVMVYGTPVFLTRLNVMKETWTSIHFSEVIKQLNLTKEQFVDFCIMCGTDYNKNIYRIGSEKAFKLIKEYASIDGIENSTHTDISILNHVRTREIFSVPDTYPEYTFEWGLPNMSEFEVFAARNHIIFDRNVVKQHICK